MKKNRNKEKVEDEEKKDYKNFLPIVILSIVLVLGLWFWNWKALNDYPADIRGTHGDMFGAVNAIFSGLAFAGIIISLYLQRIDLKNQFKEIKKTNEEFEIQNETLQLQKFENTFFNMLTNHHQIVDSIDIEPTILFKNNNELYQYIYENKKEYFIFSKEAELEGRINSRDVFKLSFDLLSKLIKDDLIFSRKISDAFYNTSEMLKYSKIYNTFKNIENKKLELNGHEEATKFQDIYNLIYFSLNTDFGHYYRNLYRIIKMIDEKEFVEDKIENYKLQYSYTSIIRSQLSDDELHWLFFNCLSDKGNEKFKPLLEKYSFLKITKENQDHIFKFYKPFYMDSAFEKPKNIEAHLGKFQ